MMSDYYVIVEPIQEKNSKQIDTVILLDFKKKSYYYNHDINGNSLHYDSLLKIKTFKYNDPLIFSLHSKNSSKIPLDEKTFIRIKNCSISYLKNTEINTFLKRYSLHEWII
jgi:hypothetical protein